MKQLVQSFGFATLLWETDTGGVAGISTHTYAEAEVFTLTARPLGSPCALESINARSRTPSLRQWWQPGRMKSRRSFFLKIVLWNHSDEASSERSLIMAGVRHGNLAPYVKRRPVLSIPGHSSRGPHHLGPSFGNPKGSGFMLLGLGRQ